jgi:peroxiredoxin
MRCALVAAMMWGSLVIVAGAQGTASAPVDDPVIARLAAEGRSALDHHRADAALKAFRDAIKRSSDSCLECRLGEAAALVQRGDAGGALKAGRKAMSIAGDDAGRASAHEAIGDVYLAMAPDAAKTDLARAEYEQAIGLAPDEADYHLKLAIALFKLSQDDAGRAETGRYLERAPDGRSAAWARRLAADPRRARERFAPEFHVTTLDGDTLSLEDLKGRFVVIDFWATWCPPCVASVSELKDITRKYPRDKLVLVSISADEDETKWREFIARNGMAWTHAWDREGALQKAYGVRGIPTYVVVDPEGIIRAQIVGLNPQKTVVSRLKAVLAQIDTRK